MYSTVPMDAILMLRMKNVISNAPSSDHIRLEPLDDAEARTTDSPLREVEVYIRLLSGKSKTIARILRRRRRLCAEYLI